MTRHLAPVPGQPRRAVLYVRVSALMGRDGEAFHSPELQTAATRRVTAGMHEVAVVEDIDVSGTTFSRRGLERIRELVEAGRVDVIAVYDLSRLGRNVLESLQFLKWLSDRGVTIISACEQIDTSTPAGEMMLVNMLSIAQYRSREIGRAWQQIINRRAEHGRHHGRPPTGYRRGDNGRLEPDPVLGPAIRDAFIAYADGVAHREIQRRLRAATGRGFAASNVKLLFTNETYLGVVRLHGGTRVEDAHEPLVDAATWERVQRRVREARTMPARHQSPRYSLSALCRCGRCGRPVVIRPDPRGAMMLCRGQHQPVRMCSGCGAPPLVKVEAAVLEEVRAYAGRLRDDLTARAERMARAARAGADTAALERELAETRRAMVRLTGRWAREQRGDAVYEQAMAELRAAEQELVARLDQARDVSTSPPPEQMVSLAERLVERWPEMDGSQRNRALRELVDHVVVNPPAYYRQPAGGRIEVHWR